MTKQKVIIGVTQVDIEPWKSIFETGQKPTWMALNNPECKIINLFGQKPSRALTNLDQIHEFLRLTPWGNGITHRIDGLISKILKRRKIPDWNESLEGHLLRIDAFASSTYVTAVIREFSLFRYFLEKTDCNYLYMTNSSSYVNIGNLLEFVETLPETGVHGGSLVNFSDFTFYSGANRIFSRDVVQILVDSFAKVDYRYFNDVAIGAILSHFAFKDLRIPSLTFANRNEINGTDLQQIKKTIHFRVKSGSLESRNDADLMHLIHSKIYE